MMKTTLILPALFLFVQSVAQESVGVQLPDSNTINTWLSENQVPAIAIGTIDQGKLNPFIVHGKNGEDQKVGSKTIFDVASLTKTITTLLTLKLVENKSWNLDEPLSKYWIDPEISNDQLHKKLTTRHVLSHQTGFKNWRWMNEDKKLAFDFEPGTKFQYSGEGFEYLRKALEKKYDTPFENLVDSLVFDRMGMNRSHLVWNSTMDNEQFAGTHDKSGKPYTYEKAFEANAADNLLTTIEDFSMLALQLIHNEYLNKGTYSEMVEPQSVVREGINFGLGWIVFNDLPNNEYALFNAGSDKGVNALIVLLPKSKRSLIVMTNGDNGRGLAMKTIGLTLGTAGQEILNRF
ncbi:serine hydrolase domain-containing protein [uncultured Croceitalea sp.]|uniref:serine hydrolase domain-containing protein n=1 Tax=uncultured Croceitalea sp. TaxID=1798908 RepID=UPI003305E017